MTLLLAVYFRFDILHEIIDQKLVFQKQQFQNLINATSKKAHFKRVKRALNRLSNTQYFKLYVKFWFLVWDVFNYSNYDRGSTSNALYTKC